MNNDMVITAILLAAMVGAGVVGAFIAEVILAAARWYCRRRGWLPEREIVFRMPMNSRLAVRDEDGSVRLLFPETPDQREDA